jgi:hypothetical protein
MRIKGPCLGGAFAAAMLSAIALFSAGCASIVHGGSRTIAVNTEPTGAHASVTKVPTGEPVLSGTTPLTVLLDPKGGYFKGQSYRVKLELRGYRTTEVTLTAEMSGWYWGNIVFGGLIGMLIVDPLTGSMWNLAPDKIDQKLSPEQAALIKRGDGFVVVLVTQVTAAERVNMVRIR